MTELQADVNSYYDKEIVRMINEKYGIAPMRALVPRIRDLPYV